MNDSGRGRLMVFGIAVIGIVVLAAAALAVRHHLRRSFDASAYTHAQRLVAIGGGRRINLYCTGSGSPTVLLDTGLGGTTLTWRFVQPVLARTTTVCSYDRAGMGFSDPGPLPRSSGAAAADLHALIGAAGLLRPLVLAGHSLGAMNVRLYAYQYPRDVAGLVLIDGADEDEKTIDVHISPAYWAAQVTQPLQQLARCRDHPTPPCSGRRVFFPAALNAERAREAAQRSTWDAEISELQSYDGVSRDELYDARRAPIVAPLGATPIMTLTHTARDHDRGVSGGDERRIAAAFLKMHEREARDSTRGLSRAVPDSGHDIELDRPGAVVDAVLEVIRDAKG